jgi:hypothetical protein
MSELKLNTSVITKAIEKAMSATVEDMLKMDPYAEDNSEIVEILEQVSALKQYKGQLLIIESLPAAGTVSFEPF